MNICTQLQQSVAPIDETYRQQSEQRQASLTKPPGSLGLMEQIAIRLSAHQGSLQPTLERVEVWVFAADHGVAAVEGVSAFPQAVTAEMVKNFARGGAAICVLCEAIGARLSVVNLGTVAPCTGWDKVLDRQIAPMTRNMAEEPAMDMPMLERALQVGAEAAEQAYERGCQLFIGGEMGIGNTTSATAMAACLCQLRVAELVGPGTGLDADGVAHKAQVIERALTRHREALNTVDGLDVLRCLGGFEIAALTGAYIRSAQLGMSVLVDGFIATSAALCARQINPEVLSWMFFAHRSAEPGHQAMLKSLSVFDEAMVDLGLRLGEASGAAVAVPLMRLSCEVMNSMATFEEAGISV